MKTTTQETIHKIRALFVRLSFNDSFEQRMPDDIRDQMNLANVESFSRDMATRSPIVQGYVELLFSDPMAWSALELVCLICYNTRRSLENVIVSKVLEQSALDELAHATPKGNA